MTISLKESLVYLIVVILSLSYVFVNLKEYTYLSLKQPQVITDLFSNHKDFVFIVMRIVMVLYLMNTTYIYM